MHTVTNKHTRTEFHTGGPSTNDDKGKGPHAFLLAHVRKVGPLQRVANRIPKPGRVPDLCVVKRVSERAGFALGSSSGWGVRANAHAHTRADLLQEVTVVLYPGDAKRIDARTHSVHQRVELDFEIVDRALGALTHDRLH